MSCNNPSRRSFLSLTAAASAVAAFRVVTEPMLARAVAQQASPGAVHIDANENPLGPCTAAREAIAAIVPEGGRYLDELTDDLAAYFARSEGLNPDYVALYPGSSNPLNFTVLAFTSPARSYVTANPGFEAGAFAAAVSGARVVNVPLTRSYSHDVKSMLAAGSDAGVFY